MVSNVFTKDRRLLLRSQQSLCQPKLSVLPPPRTLRTSRPGFMVFVIDFWISVVDDPDNKEIII